MVSTEDKDLKKGKEFVRHGFGAMQYNDGNIYEGYWANNICHHQGIPKQIKGVINTSSLQLKYSTLIFNNGNIYEGEFNQGRIEGQGTYKWINGDTYTGIN